jgi:hypothetical protein
MVLVYLHGVLVKQKEQLKLFASFAKYLRQVTTGFVFCLYCRSAQKNSGPNT